MSSSVELLSLVKKETFGHWKNFSKLHTTYDSSAKSYVLELEKGSRIESNSACKVIDSHLIIQAFVESINNFSVELAVLDSSKLKKRIIFSSCCKELIVNQMHVRVPFTTLPLMKWINIEFDLDSVCGYFSGKSCFRSLESVGIQFEGKLKKVCTLRNPIKEIIMATNAIPKSLQMPSGVEIENVIVKLGNQDYSQRHLPPIENNSNLMLHLKGKGRSAVLVNDKYDLIKETIENNKESDDSNEDKKEKSENKISGNISNNALNIIQHKNLLKDKFGLKNAFIGILEDGELIEKPIHGIIKSKQRLAPLNIDPFSKKKSTLLAGIGEGNIMINKEKQFKMSKALNKMEIKRTKLLSNGKPQNMEANQTNPKLLSTIEYKKLADFEKSGIYGTSELIAEDIQEINDTTKFLKANHSIIQSKPQDNTSASPQKAKINKLKQATKNEKFERQYGFSNPLANKYVQNSNFNNISDIKIDNHRLEIPEGFNNQITDSLSKQAKDFKYNCKPEKSVQIEFDFPKPAFVYSDATYTPPLQD